MASAQKVRCSRIIQQTSSDQTVHMVMPQNSAAFNPSSCTALVDVDWSQPGLERCQVKLPLVVGPCLVVASGQRHDDSYVCIARRGSVSVCSLLACSSPGHTTYAITIYVLLGTVRVTTQLFAMRIMKRARTGWASPIDGRLESKFGSHF